MCRVADVAMAIINKSIEFARETEDPAYYMDFVKLHKLLYWGQCQMLSTYSQPLFVEEITAHQCGPYVSGIHFVPKMRGFGVITVPFSSRDFVTPSYNRMSVIESVIETVGAYTTEDLIELTKNTGPYRAVEDRITESVKPIISQGSIARFATQITL